MHASLPDIYIHISRYILKLTGGVIRGVVLVEKRLAHRRERRDDSLSGERLHILNALGHRRLHAQLALAEP